MPQSHRRPPKPHKDYLILATSAQQRKAAWERDRGFCAGCRQFASKWHAEHIFALWLVDRTAWPECLRYWTISNLQTLCEDCHKPKTAREAKARAKIKRIVKKANGPARSGVSKWPKRVIPSRPWPKGKRKIASRKLRG